MELFARLDSTTGLRVLCGGAKETCRGELARVVVIEGMRRLCMLDGWKHTGRGHWTLSNHSARRLRGTESAIARGKLDPAQLSVRGRPRFRQPIPDERDVYRLATGLDADNYIVAPGGDGILADCPRCGHTNTLSAANLRVEAQ